MQWTYEDFLLNVNNLVQESQENVLENFHKAQISKCLCLLNKVFTKMAKSFSSTSTQLFGKSIIQKFKINYKRSLSSSQFHYTKQRSRTQFYPFNMD